MLKITEIIVAKIKYSVKMAGSVDQFRKTKKPGQEAAILTIVVLHPIVRVEKKITSQQFFLRRVYKVLRGVWDLSEVA